MRKLVVSAFASLDGVMQAPGGPEEDPTGGFALGGWMSGYGDESMDISANPALPQGDVSSALVAHKARPGADLQVIGSGNPMQTLQAASLIDEYHVWTFCRAEPEGTGSTQENGEWGVLMAAGWGSG